MFISFYHSLCLHVAFIPHLSEHLSHYDGCCAIVVVIIIILLVVFILRWESGSFVFVPTMLRRQEYGTDG